MNDLQKITVTVIDKYFKIKIKRMKSNMLGLYGIGMIIICAVAVQAISRTDNKIQNGTAVRIN